MSARESARDANRLQQILCDLNDQLLQQDIEALKTSERAIREESVSPQTIMDVLAPLVFQPESEKNTLAGTAALNILGYFITVDPSRYLIPASLAVKKEAHRLSKSGESMVVAPELLAVLVDQVSKRDVTVATNAAATIVACSRKLGLPLAEPTLRAVMDEWKLALGRMGSDRSLASTVAVRCVDITASLMFIDDAMMKAAVNAGASTLIITMMTDDNDPLLQISILETVERLASTLPMSHERASWLFSDAVIKPLLLMAGGSDEAIDSDPFLGGPALRVLAALCKLGHTDGSSCVTSSSLLTGFHRALQKFQRSGELERLALLDAVSSFASASDDALQMILDDGDTREGWLSLKVAQPKLKAAILYSVCMVLDPKQQVDSNGDIIQSAHGPSEKLSLKLYAALGRANDHDTTRLAMSLASSPLPETRLASYALLIAAGKKPTGGQVLLAHDGFLEFLLRREGENTKEGREARFELVATLLRSEVKVLLADNIVRQLETYVSQGAHYSKAMSWELATE